MNNNNINVWYSCEGDHFKAWKWSFVAGFPCLCLVGCSTFIAASLCMSAVHPLPSPPLSITLFISSLPGKDCYIDRNAHLDHFRFSFQLFILFRWLSTIWTFAIRTWLWRTPLLSRGSHQQIRLSARQMVPLFLLMNHLWFPSTTLQENATQVHCTSQLLSPLLFDKIYVTHYLKTQQYGTPNWCDTLTIFI